MRAEKVRYAQSRDGAKIAWIESGQGLRTLVLAPNSLTEVADDWRNPLRSAILGAYSEQFRVIRFDDRGFGHSSRTVQYGPERWADDIEAVASAAGVREPFILFGQSMVYGVVTFSARAPERLSHLLIYGGRANGVEGSGIPSLIDGARAQREIRRLGWGRNDPGARALLTAYLAKDMTEAEMRYFAERDISRIANVDDAIRHSEADAAADVRPVLGLIRTPTLVGHARGDQAIPVGLGRKLAGAIPDAAFVEIRSDNHALRTRDGSLATWMKHVLDFVGNSTTAMASASPLSRREREILSAVREGLTNKRIADRLGISEKTVRNHLTHVFSKLGVASRTQAAIAHQGQES